MARETEEPETGEGKVINFIGQVLSNVLNAESTSVTPSTVCVV